jgi:hypothetical protein
MLLVNCLVKKSGGNFNQYYKEWDSIEYEQWKLQKN